MLSSTQSTEVAEEFHSICENRLGTAVRQPRQPTGAAMAGLSRGFGAPQHTLESVTVSPSRCYYSDTR